MSVYNGEKYLREAIESILLQTFTDFEFIIVNDNSTDNSLEIIQNYKDERIKVINNIENIGLTKSLNRSLKIAKGEYIARQDADDISLTNRFEEQIEYLKAHPEVMLLGTSVYFIDESGKMTGKCIALAKPRDELFKDNQFSHGSTMFKKDVINRLGGYNELFRYVQDYELWLRIAEFFEVRNLTQILYKLRFHKGTIGFTSQRDSALYHLLALRSINNTLDKNVLKALDNEGISGLYYYLNKEEFIYLYKSIAAIYIRGNNIKLARNEYKKVFVLNPFDTINLINIIRSYFGKDVMTKTNEIYVRFMNIKRLK